MKNKFRESLDTAVLTSKYVASKVSTIIYVAHHDDGIWEFWGKEIINESEIMVVSLKEIIELDSSVLEIADMPVAFVAIRSSKDTAWQIAPKN